MIIYIKKCVLRFFITQYRVKLLQGLKLLSMIACGQTPKSALQVGKKKKNPLIYRIRKATSAWMQTKLESIIILLETSQGKNRILRFISPQFILCKINIQKSASSMPLNASNPKPCTHPATTPIYYIFLSQTVEPVLAPSEGEEETGPVTQ